MKWHTLPADAVLKELETSERGLTKQEAEERLKEYGANALPEGKTDSLFIILLRQFKSPLIYVLMGAAATIYAIGEVIDAGVIAFVLLFNAVVGALQEGRAQNALLALKKFAETHATLIRGGHTVRIVDRDVVPGDIIILQGGDTVPADARLLRVYSLRIDEAALTGESLPIEKNAEPIETANLSPADQRNMVFRGTLVSAGQATAVVVATGSTTEIGKIAENIATIDTEIPLTRDIRALSRTIIYAVVALSLGLFFLGTALGNTLHEMFIVVVSLAVSAIPEGLPIVVTLVLATGVRRMSKRNALVKRLKAVEALGQTDIICVDKTGTITRNEMVVRTVFVNDTLFEIDGDGYNPTGTVRRAEKAVDPTNHPELILAGKIAALSSNAQLLEDEGSRWHITGDPTEAALTVFSRKTGCAKAELEQELELVHDIPFESSTKYHASVHNENGKHFLSVVGAPEVVLKLCTHLWHDGESRPLTNRERSKIERQFSVFSERGLRVVASAFREYTTAKQDGRPRVEKLVFTALYAMIDAIRPEVQRSIERAHEAGMEIVMITGDHRVTAESIATEVGIFRKGDIVLTGEDIDALDDKELAQRAKGCTLFARATPEHKLRIIRAFKSNGKIVAMTGDGVNDAPSLMAADLGVGMGKIGTDVAKEASDIVLLDDNFGTIVAAVEEGRAIYKTLQKVILYLFSTNIGEVLAIAGALLIGFPLPLVAAQIIWMNLVTDGFMVIALAVEPKDKGLLKGRMERVNSYLVNRGMVVRMALMALPMAVGTLWYFSQYLESEQTKACTIACTTLVLFKLFTAFNCRSEKV
ncbi:MAG: HAD-IC family P-type ATPase, partial [Patescibacteria group bacterium]